MNERDQKLIEFAAKAHGFIDDEKTEGDGSAQLGLHKSTEGEFYFVNNDGWRGWNPLADDGQAHRLAIELNMLVALFEDGKFMKAHTEVYFCTIDIYEPHNHASDKFAATRRAIVRAAAEFGEGMK